MEMLQNVPRDHLPQSALAPVFSRSAACFMQSYPQHELAQHASVRPAELL